MIKKLILAAALVVGIAGVLVAPPQPAYAQAVEHCPGANEGNADPLPAGYTSANKVESGASGNNIVLSAGTHFCVKGGPGSTGILVSDGVRTLKQYLEDEGVTNPGGNVPNVSYYIVYELANSNGHSWPKVNLTINKQWVVLEDPDNVFDESQITTTFNTSYRFLFSWVTDTIADGESTQVHESISRFVPRTVWISEQVEGLNPLCSYWSSHLDSFALVAKSDRTKTVTNYVKCDEGGRGGDPVVPTDDKPEKEVEKEVEKEKEQQVEAPVSGVDAGAGPAGGRTRSWHRPERRSGRRRLPCPPGRLTADRAPRPVSAAAGACGGLPVGRHQRQRALRPGQPG
jgi:hypothetical protein